MRVVAAFDFDGTLSTRDNVVPFLRAAVGGGRLAVGIVATTPRLVAAAVDDGRRDRAKAALVRRLLTGYETARLTEIAERFADELVIVSASFTAYLEPIARRLGFDASLGTELETGADGHLTGRLLGPNVRRAEKVRRLDDWMGGGPATVWAYGDSTGDRELFERADHAVRVGRGSLGA